MWYLTSETDQRTLYVDPSKDITIGRGVDAQVNFSIPDDLSISRKHATLSASDGCLHVQDQGSRYGTFVNDFDEKLDSSKRKLKPGDTVRFGKMSCVWRVHEVRFITCTSTLKGEDLPNLQVCLQKLRGTLKGEWDDSVAYLTMPAITLTIKVVLALAQGSHIVTIEFWKKCVDAISKQALLPDPRMYTPQIVESTLNQEIVSFHPNEDRKKLFAGKTIIFFSRRQLDMYKAVLLKCSATPLLLSESKMTKTSLCDSNVIVIQSNLSTLGAETQEQNIQIAEIVSYMKNKGKRVIADAEIGLAILSCSTDQYCNPDMNYSLDVLKQSTPAATGKVLVQESQDPSQKSQRENVIINDSLNISSKRKFSEENDDTGSNASKKLATEQNSGSNDHSSESIKRKRDDSEDVTNANKKVAVESGENGLFDFLNNSTPDENNFQEKKFNFKKPAPKRAATNEEEELFNFVEDKSKAKEDSGNNIFDSNTVIKTEPIEHKEESVDINALRGANLKDLENASRDAPPLKKLKIEKEEQDDLDTKMNDLDLGTTILTIKKELIIKKEPVEVVQQDYTQMNFKKFKKVWPLHMHVTVVPRSTITIEIPDDDETPAAACGTTPERSEASDITQSTDSIKEPEMAGSADILKDLAEQHGITDSVQMETDGVSREPIDEFISQAY